MRILIVDDEAPARQRLKQLLEDLGGHEIVGEAANGQDALKLGNQLDPDVILLDIRMPGMDGMECARHISARENSPAVVFTTAYDQYAIEAFEARAVGYLLKPVRKERLESALTQARRLTSAEADSLHSRGGSRPRQFISVGNRDELQLFPVAEVLYFQADQKYVSMIHQDGTKLLGDSLKALEEEFSEEFVRIHRAILVSLAHLEALEKDDEGHFQVRIRGKSNFLPVSRRMVPELRKRMRHN
ncbi:MAG: LytTR family DNA-binding domain-containing protein [Chromatiales bacterium]|nr:LytTR family DNA-binding domain-containing protein [Chromatiales bacterium]